MKKDSHLDEAVEEHDPTGAYGSELLGLFLDAMAAEEDSASQIEMGEIGTTWQLARVTGKVLDGYVDIHDEIFGSRSLWSIIKRVVPIPGVFEAIDFNEYVDRLGCQIGSLTSAIAQVPRLREVNPSHEEFLDFYLTYAAALLDSIGKFQAIFSKLYEKSQGQGGFTYREYSRDLSAYRKSMKHYSKLGIRLEELLPTIY